MGKPFKLSTPGTSGENTSNAGRGAQAYDKDHGAPTPPGKAAKKAADEGVTLVEAGESIAEPGYDIGGEGEGGMGPHKPAIPWPPVEAKKPFKLNGG